MRYRCCDGKVIKVKRGMTQNEVMRIHFWALEEEEKRLLAFSPGEREHYRKMFPEVKGKRPRTQDWPILYD